MDEKIDMDTSMLVGEEGEKFTDLRELYQQATNETNDTNIDQVYIFGRKYANIDDHCRKAAKREHGSLLVPSEHAEQWSYDYRPRKRVKHYLSVTRGERRPVYNPMRGSQILF